MNYTNYTQTERDILLAHQIYVTCVESFRIFFHLVVLVLIIVFGRYQPLKSRFIVPYLHNIAMLANACRYIPFVWVTNQPKIHNYLRLYFDYPIACIAYTTYAHHAIRYLLIRTVVNTKLQNYASKKTTTARDTQTLKRLVSNWLMVLVVGLVWLVWMVFAGIITAMYETNSISESNVTLAISIALLVVCVAICIIIVTVLLIDTIINRGDLFFEGKLTLRRFFSETDPHRFRSELPFLFVALAVGLVYQIFVVSQIFFTTVQNAQADFVGEFIFLVYSFLVAWIGGGVALLFTMRDRVRGVHNKSYTIEEFKDSECMALLQDETKGQYIMEQYCKNEFSLENFMLYKDIQQYKNMKVGKKETLASDIYETYVKKGTLMEANLTDAARSALNNCLTFTSGDDDNSGLDSAIFDIESECIFNLHDTFSRLQETTHYKAYKESLELSTALQGKVYNN